MHWFIAGWVTVLVLLHKRLPWSLVQQLQSVLNSVALLIFGLKRFDHITPVLMDLHWLPYPQRITYKLCVIMFKCLRGSAPAYLAFYCTSTSLVPPWPIGFEICCSWWHCCSQSSDWLGFEIFCDSWPQQLECFGCWFEVFFCGFDTFLKHLNTHLFGLAYSRQSTHFWVRITICRVWHGDSVTKPDYYYHYYC